MSTTAVFLAPQVPPRLAPYVADITAYEMRGYDAGIHVGLPSTALTFIIAFDGGIDVTAMPRPDRPPQRFGALISGLHDGPVQISHDGTQVGIQLGLTPAGARALLDRPAGSLASEVVPLEDVLGAAADRTVARLHEVDGWPRRLAVLIDELEGLIGDGPAARPDVTAAWSLLTDDAPRPVAWVARELGWSRRHLGQMVQAEFGLSPKAIASTARFDRARRLIIARPDLTLAAVAARCGFADQSHLTREWHRFAGTSPRAWLQAEALPFVQADEDGPAAR